MPRRIVYFIRERIITTLAVVVVVGLVANAYGLVRYAQLSDRIVEARQHDCESGNVVRGHIQFVTSALHDLLVLSLAAPPRPDETPAQTALRQRFAEINDRLGERLPALAQRNCSARAVTAGAPTPTLP